MINQRNEVHVSFLMAKSRVPPIKPISIPRLELTAAVVSVNVTRMLKSELDVDNVQCYYYTDSEIVIGYINNDARRFHVYVGNRVQHIRDRSSPEEWFHVPGKENPADEASRGLTAKEYKVNAGSKDQVFCGKKIHFPYNNSLFAPRTLQTSKSERIQHPRWPQKSTKPRPFKPDLEY